MTAAGYAAALRATLTWEVDAEALARIAAPAVVMVGGRDTAHRAAADACVRAMPRVAQLVSWPAAHVPQLETPHETATLIAHMTLGRSLGELLPTR